MSARHGPIVITGAPGVGKSTICRMASARLECAAHIEADELHRMIVTGAEWPNAGTPDSQAQLLLRTRNAAQVAANFSDAGITPIVDEVIATHEQLDILDEILAGANVTFVVLGASAQAILERDAGRHKHTAAHYLGVDQLVSGVLAGRAAFLDTTELSPEETVNAVQGIVPNVGWLAT